MLCPVLENPDDGIGKLTLGTLVEQQLAGHGEPTPAIHQVARGQRTLNGRRADAFGVIRQGLLVEVRQGEVHGSGFIVRHAPVEHELTLLRGSQPPRLIANPQVALTLLGDVHGLPRSDVQQDESGRLAFGVQRLDFFHPGAYRRFSVVETGLTQLVAPPRWHVLHLAVVEPNDNHPAIGVGHSHQRDREIAWRHASGLALEPLIFRKGQQRWPHLLWGQRQATIHDCRGH